MYEQENQLNQVSNVIFHLVFSELSRDTTTYEKCLEPAEMNKTQPIHAYEKQQGLIKKEVGFSLK